MREMRTEFTSLDLNAKYYVFLIGIGCGCDYTIGCNIEFCSLSAQTLEDARKEVADEHVGEGGAHEDAIIIEASQVETFDVEGHVQNVMAAKDEDKRLADSKKERKEYERLKSKFEVLK